jgi:precorrin-6A/cobalt-precorrin-6A reductase
VTIWLIGGTQESVILARAIAQAQWPCTVSVTTPSARSLYPNTPGLEIWVGHLTPANLADFLRTRSISCILDASHPFAIAISQLAIEFAQQQALPYLRYERPPEQEGLCHGRFPNFEALLATEILSGERVLLTIGYRFLPLFQAWQDRATLFARILPSVVALETALNAGFSPDRLIALRPPISPELERALWQQWQISLVVTKASGAPGGETIKQQVATELNRKLILIDRPAIEYPSQAANLEVALRFCQQFCQR